jgi:hypothetical protein
VAAVLDLDPMLLPASAIGSITMLGYETFKTELVTKMSFCSHPSFQI